MIFLHFTMIKRAIYQQIRAFNKIICYTLGRPMSLTFPTLLLVAACVSPQNIPEHKSYTSSLGSFECRDYPFDIDVDESLGPHGGTIHIRDGMREIRFDLEELNPELDQDTLKTIRTSLYKGYLHQNTIPMIRSVSPEVKLLEAKPLTLEKPDSLAGLQVYQSAILMVRQETVRAQIQYTDGRFIYTMSSLTLASNEWSKDKLLEAAYEQLLTGLSWCHFPRLNKEYNI